MLTIYQTKINPEVIKFIETNKYLLTPDLSNYAKGRYRCWIGCEAPLTDKQKFRLAPFNYNSRLWLWLDKFCRQKLNFEPELGLLHVGGADCSDPEENPTDGNGGQCGIKEHRDAGYADYKAIGINLIGEATFGYRDCYGSQDSWQGKQNMNAKPQIVKMEQGTCVVFNCKNPHFAQVGPNRWCINAWRISKKRRKEFDEFKNANWK